MEIRTKIIDHRADGIETVGMTAKRKTGGLKNSGAKAAKKKTVRIPEPDHFLKRFPPPIRALADKMRAAVKKSGLDLEESVLPGWQLISYKLIKGARRKYFCFIAPTAERVTLGFQQGTALRDPAGILEGNEVHIRRIVVRKNKDIKVRLFAEYTREAAEIALMSKAERTARKVENEMNLRVDADPAD